ncbi:uncharacterized protein LOC107815682 [Nicotiana tabacum]|uniref:Uncharacterized protein LOC107815682 n=1 Tax=Nicotiana tabacum TaxID=4097 RepID=A0A1S4C6N6_TOBAC|nr:PREDICTED: uncharacterized protein LOC107815682 [Nicotiana tabacum]
MADIVALLSNAYLRELIIDSGATHHITCNKEVLNNTKGLETKEGNYVQLPTRSRAEITHKRDAMILGDQYINNVLYVPDFKFNLLSVAKLTKDLRCFVGFYHDFCLLQELYNGKVLGIGKESGSLYVLKERGAVVAAGSVSKEHTEKALCHFRLGHASLKAMQYISSLQDRINTIQLESCSICPLAKQCGLQFFLSNSKSTTIFELVHLDVWGPYKVPTYDRKRIPSSILTGKIPFKLLYGKDYAKTQKGYMLYDMETLPFFVSRDVQFREDCFPFKMATFEEGDPFFQQPTQLIIPQSDQISTPCDNVDTYHHAQPTPLAPPADDSLPEDNVEIDIVDAQLHDHHMPDVAEPAVAETNEHHVPAVVPQDSAPSCTTKRPQRKTGPPIWMKHYVNPTKGAPGHKYPASNHVGYSHISAPYQSYLQAF